MRAIDIDCLIVGGGMQGIALLHELRASGARDVLLVSAGELGAGETLHGHGYLHHGYSMATAGDYVTTLVPELLDAARGWRPRIGPPYAPGPPVYFALRAEDASARAELWDRLGLAHRGVPDLPDALRGGAADSAGVRLLGIDDRLVSMRDLLAELAAPLQDRIVGGRVTALELDARGERVERCRLWSGGAERIVRPRVVLLANGRGAQPLLRRATTPSGARPLEPRCAGMNRVRMVPMLLVRGFHLPQISGIFETHGLSLFTHPPAAHPTARGESMWILTPAQGHAIERGDFDPAAELASGGAVIGETVSRLCALVPEARERLGADLRFDFYFGGKTDHPDGGNRRHVDGCGLANLRLAWPGVWSLASINAREIVAELRASSELGGLFDGQRAPLDPAAAGLVAGVPTGTEVRLAPGRPWQRWSELRALHRIP